MKPVYGFIDTLASLKPVYDVVDEVFWHRRKEIIKGPFLMSLIQPFWHLRNQSQFEVYDAFGKILW